MTPLILVSTEIRAADGLIWHAALDTYLNAVTLTGAAPVLLPSLGDKLDLAAILSRADGVLLTGSRSNVHPSHYGAEPSERHEPYDHDRDATTLKLIPLAIDMGVPLFAVCRGFQELNVALGGTLITEAQERPGSLDHRAPIGLPQDERFKLAHDVNFEEDSQLAKLLGARCIKVNSVHRQVLDRLSTRLGRGGARPRRHDRGGAGRRRARLRIRRAMASGILGGDRSGLGRPLPCIRGGGAGARRTRSPARGGVKMQNPDDHEHTHGHDHAHHDHAHDHDHRGSHLDDIELRVRALETLLVEKGYVDPAALDVFIETYEKKIGPRNGAKVVAKAWSDPAYREWLLKDATAAIASLGFTGRQSEHMVALENTLDTHNMVVCTLCSCYPVAVLGLPPVWYKSAPYRSRAVIDPRGVLAEFGVDAAGDDPHPHMGFHRRDPLSRRPDAPRRHRRMERGAARRSGDPQFHDWHGPAALAQGVAMNGPHDLGGAHGFGPIAPEPDEPCFMHEWERRAAALSLAMNATGTWNIDMVRHARERIPPAEYLAASYYEKWLKGLERLLVEGGLATQAEIDAGHGSSAPRALPRKVAAVDVSAMLSKGSSL